jgi:DNA-binding MarR family transcriptional regulator
MKKTAKKQKIISVQFQDETKVHPALKEYFGYCLFKASARMRSLMDNALVDLKMQTHHFGILKILEMSGPISQIQLGEELGIDKASMVKLIDLLEKNNFVSRQAHPNDRRIKNIKLTALGKKSIKNCNSLKDKVEAEFFSSIELSHRNLLRKLIPLLLPKH